MNHDPECTCAACMEDSARDSAMPDFSRYTETLRQYEKKPGHRQQMREVEARHLPAVWAARRQAESGGAR